jgi:hypothetical protein
MREFPHYPIIRRAQDHESLPKMPLPKGPTIASLIFVAPLAQDLLLMFSDYLNSSTPRIL